MAEKTYLVSPFKQKSHTPTEAILLLFLFSSFFSPPNESLMNVRVQSVHFDADQKLIDFVKEKVAKLQTFHDKIVDVDVILKLDNVAHTIKDKIAEIRVAVPKHNYFVKHQSKTFEESFGLALESMTEQLKRQKQRLAMA